VREQGGREAEIKAAREPERDGECWWGMKGNTKKEWGEEKKMLMPRFFLLLLLLLSFILSCFNFLSGKGVILCVSFLLTLEESCPVLALCGSVRIHLLLI